MSAARTTGWRSAAMLALFVVVAVGVGSVAGIVTVPNVLSWYPTLAKPWFNPPNWIFGPVWTVLYVLMSWAAWRVWRVRGLMSAPLYLYAVQLALNFSWSIVFFGLHRVGLALIDVAALWLFVLLTLLAFWRADRLAGIAFVPYLAWVSFASLLNYAIWMLNR